jgi:hypothetical protein
VPDGFRHSTGLPPSPLSVNVSASAVRPVALASQAPEGAKTPQGVIRDIVLEGNIGWTVELKHGRPSYMPAPTNSHGSSQFGQTSQPMTKTSKMKHTHCIYNAIVLIGIQI